MKIEFKHPDELTPYDNNPRNHPEEQVLELMKGIQNFGFDQPIVVDPNGVVIKGHGRLIAAKRLKLSKVPVVVRAISENDARLLRVLDNESVSGDWDYHALNAEIVELQGAGVDVTSTGFTMEALGELLVPETPLMAAVPDTTLAPTKHTCKQCGYHF